MKTSRFRLKLEEAFADKLKKVPEKLAGTKVRETITIDGNKFILADGSWLLFRKSGTEPVVRLYGEASSPERLAEVMTAGRDLILNEPGRKVRQWRFGIN